MKFIGNKVIVIKDLETSNHITFSYHNKKIHK